MSGESSGLVLIPILAVAYPPLGIALAGGALAVGIANAAVNANRAERRRREREAIRQANQERTREIYRREAEQRAQQQRQADYRAQQQREAEFRAQQQREAAIRAQQEQIRSQQMDMVSNSIGDFRTSVADNMREQTRINRQISDQMMSELEMSRNEMLSVINSNDPEQYKKYTEELGKSKSALTKKIVSIQDGFVKNYHQKINESMEAISKDVNKQYASHIDELKAMQADIQKKNELASSLAQDYIEEATTLLTALNEDYNGQKYSKNQMLEIERTINDASKQYNIGNYEAAIAIAKDSALAAIEEIYKADCRQQEWDNYYKLALTVASEVTAFIKGQETITAEAKAKVEQQLGKAIEDDIVGIKVSDYTEKRMDGKTQYEYLLGQAESILQTLESDQVENLTVEQLKDYVELLNTRIYPAASETIFKGILNMSNAFSRQNISEEIIDFFEEHNFDFKGFSYDDEKHDGALRIGLENDSTGEEIIVTLAPELLENGEVQTRVEIDQLKGDETNEARKEFYRKSVQQCVCDNTPGAQVKLECKKESKNKLSDRTSLRDRLK